MKSDLALGWKRLPELDPDAIGPLEKANRLLRGSRGQRLPPALDEMLHRFGPGFSLFVVIGQQFGLFHSTIGSVEFQGASNVQMERAPAWFEKALDHHVADERMTD